MANQERKSNGNRTEVLKRISYEKLLAGSFDPSVFEGLIRSGIIEPLSQGRKEEFIQSATTANGKKARAALFGEGRMPDSPIEERIQAALTEVGLINTLETKTFPKLTNIASQNENERGRRDNKRENVRRDLQTLWQSPLDKWYVQGLQDAFDTHYLLPDQVEEGKSHVAPRVFTGLEGFVERVKYDKGKLLLSEGERIALLGAPQTGEIATTYGSLARDIGAITTPGKFEGQFMHSGQLEMTLLSFANTLFSFIENTDNFPKGKKERALWDSIRTYVDATDDESNEMVLVRFQKRIQTAFKKHTQEAEKAEAPTIFFPFDSKKYEDILTQLADICSRQKRVKEKEVTIDKTGTRLYEDAFSVTQSEKGHFRLKISTIDVLSVLADQPELLLDAMKRRKTEYDDEGKRISLFPPELTFKDLNLQAGTDIVHPGITFVIDFNKNFQPSLGLQLTSLQITDNLPYELANAPHLLNPTSSSQLDSAKVLATNLARIRRKDGDFIAAIDRQDPSKTSERFIAEFMTLLNKLVGKYLTQAPYTPAIHLQQTTRVDGERYFRYTTDPYLAVQKRGYARVSSPVANADSLTNQIILLAKVFGQGKAFTQQELAEFCDYLNVPYDALYAK